MEVAISRLSIRCYGARRLNLNSAALDVLLRMSRLGVVRARRLIQHRPYRSWDDIEQIPGFDRYVVYGLQQNSYLGPSLSIRNSDVRSEMTGHYTKDDHLGIGESDLKR
jgi:hypothetical protein